MIEFSLKYSIPITIVVSAVIGLIVSVYLVIKDDYPYKIAAATGVLSFVVLTVMSVSMITHPYLAVGFLVVVILSVMYLSVSYLASIFKGKK